MAKIVKKTSKIESLSTREKLLKEALKLVAKNGLGETSFQTIAKSCGVAATAPFYYFKTKQDLLAALITPILGNNASIVAKTMEPQDSALVRCQKHFEGNLRWALSFPEEAQVILLLYYSAGHDPKFRTLYQTVLKIARSRIAEFLYAAQREGLASPDLDVLGTSELLHDALLGGIVNLIASGDKLDQPELILAKWNRLIEQVLNRPL